MKIIQKKPYLIYNPYSGKKKGSEQAGKLISEWNSIFPQSLTAISTDSRNDIKTLAAEYYKKENFCIFMGGDGTLSLALQGISEKKDFKKLKEPFSFLPGGTGNSYLRDFGISNFNQGKNLLFEAVQTNRIRRSDAGLIISYDSEKKVIAGTKNKKQANIDFSSCVKEKRIFCNVISMGLAAEISELAEKMRYMGSLSYTFATLMKLPFHKTRIYSIKNGGSAAENQRCDFISIANSKYTGGAMLIAPRSKINDGKLFFILPSIESRLKILALFPKIFSGEHLNHPRVKSHFIEEIHFQNEKKILFVVDGELEEYETPAVRVLPEHFPICI